MNVESVGHDPIHQRLDTADKILGLVQKIFVIVGILLSAYIFVLRDEVGPRVQIDINAEMMANCIVRIDAAVSNVSGRTWTMNAAVAKVLPPDLGNTLGTSTNGNEAVGSQTHPGPEVLRVGETQVIGFNVPIDKSVEHGYLVVRLFLTLEEESNPWTWVGETFVLSAGC